MLNHKLLLMILTFIFTFHAYSYDPSDGNITVSFGPFGYKTIFPDTDTGAHSNSLAGYGIILNGDIDAKGSLEIALFHITKMFFREEGGKAQVEQTQVMHISMGYRRWYNPYLSGALGFYSGYPMDDAKVVHTDFAPGTEIYTSARDKTEYGFDFSIQSELWGNGIYTVLADARYALSVTNKSGEKSDHYGFMLALKYLFQEKYNNLKKETK